MRLNPQRILYSCFRIFPNRAEPWMMNRSVWLLLGFAILFSVIFVADLRGYFNQASDPVAFLGNSSGIVKRLGNNQLTWDHAQKGTGFGAGDTIATGEGASARVMFKAGGELELEPGAMVVIGGSLEELKLNFVSGGGRIRVDKKIAQKLTITDSASAPVGSGDRRPASSRVQVAVVENLETEKAPKALPKPEPPVVMVPAVKESEVDLSKALGANSKAGELLTIAKLPPMPEVVGPGEDAVVDLAKTTSPRLEWKLPELDEDEEVPVAGFEIILRSPTGEKKQKVYRTKDQSLALTRLSRGKYLWTVRALTKDGKRGPASSSRWLEVRVPANISKPRLLPVQVQ